ncbi:MAG: hypothetical protein AAGE76_10130 [Pseudomonadota bacterium]
MTRTIISVLALAALTACGTSSGGGRSQLGFKADVPLSSLTASQRRVIAGLDSDGASTNEIRRRARAFASRNARGR